MSASRECAGCGGQCYWADDAWVCNDCGDEWYPQHGTVYNPPDEGEDN